MSKKKKMKNSKFLAIWVPCLAVAGGAIIAIECILPSFSTILDTYAGTIWAPLGKGETVKTPAKGSENWNSNYYTMTYEKSTEKNSGSAKAKANGESVVEEICDEGMVLLKNKNNNSLPISTSNKIALLGRGAVDPVYGGSGSGNVDTTTCANPKSALEKAGFTVDENVYNFFNKEKDNYARQNISMDNYDNSTFFIGEIDPSTYSFNVDSSETAVVFISRCGGEGLDLSRNMKQDATTTASKKILEGGDTVAANAQKEVNNYVDGQHELELSKEEKDMISFAKTNYSKVIVVLNDSTTMEVGDLQNDDGIDGIIWAGSPGVSGFNALGSILAGTISPSGRTPDLYSRDFTADPTYANFATNGVNEYTGVTSIDSGNGKSEKAHFVEYEEGIYVGYRYYETRYGSNETEYNNQVVYPFGYGLSYTTFSKTLKAYDETSDSVTLTIEVKNTGNVAGKEVVQLYYTAPYTEGGIEKASTVLGDFAKTKTLQPEETDTVTVSIDKEDMASYDYNDKNHNNFKGYELEKGTYTLQIKENSHTVSTDANGKEISYSFTVDETKQYRQRSSDKSEVTNQFDDVSAIFKDTKTEGYATSMSRSDFGGTFPTTPTSADAAADKISINGKTISDLLKPYENVNNDEDKMPTTGAKNGISLIDVRGLDYDDEKYEKLLDQLTEDDYAHAGDYLTNGAYNTPAMSTVDKPATEDHDGPQGFSSLMGKYNNVTAYMSEPLLAATFNKELGKKMGTAIGEESLSMNTTFSGWYGPAMNTHRSPFAGRNFEYYSEDGVLAGKIAANVVSGAADKGLYAYIKHFALNDQETWRTEALCTWADEQTIREVYLKPFEIVVKEAKTTIDYISDNEGNHTQKEINACTAVMSSFNRIGTTWAGGSKALMTTVLRDEWGFRGFGLSDFNLYNYMVPDQGMRAGTDMQLTWKAYKTTTEDGFNDTSSATARQALRKAYHNVFYTVANSNAMQGIAPGTTITYKLSGWRIMFIIIDVVLGAFVILGTTWVLIRVLVLSKKYNQDEETDETKAE